MEYLDPGLLQGPSHLRIRGFGAVDSLKPAYRDALAIFARVSARGQHDRRGAARRKPDAQILQPAFRASEQRLGQVALEAHHQRLAFRIAESNVVLEPVDSVANETQAHEHHPPKQ